MLKGLVQRFEEHIMDLQSRVNEGPKNAAETVKEKLKILTEYKRRLSEFSRPGYSYKAALYSENTNDGANLSPKNNAELQAQTQERLKDHEKKFDLIIDATKKIKYAGQDMVKENDVHEGLLNELNTEVIFYINVQAESNNELDR